MKKVFIFMLLALLILTGCQDHTTEPPTAESSITATESMVEETASPPTVPTESSFQPETQATEPEQVAEATDPPQTAQPQSTRESKQTTESAAEVTAPKPTPTEPPVPETTAPPETEPVVTEPQATETPSSQPVTEEEEVPETTAPMETEPPEPETNPPTEETTPVTEPEPEEPEPFDIASWVSFAKSYAQSIGLNLDSTAVDCWDNPITAGSHCIYLERDICNRLNRYNADEDITDVWIWAVDVGNGCYDLYIGYA